MRTAVISLFIVSSLSPAQCNPLLTTSLASEPPPPPLNSVFPVGSKKMEVKWEPFRDIFENIIRPIGGEHDVAAMLENVKEEDIDTLEGTLLDKAKDDPEFVEQILTHLIHIRERYIKLRKDWQKTIEDRDKTAKIFKARIVDTRSDPSSALLPSNGQPVQFTQSFTPNTGLTNVSPVINTNPPPTRPPPPSQPFFTTVAVADPGHFTVSSETLPNSIPPQLDQEEVEEDLGSFLAPPSHSSPPSDFFFVPNHVIDPQIDPNNIIFDTAIPQFASRGSPPAPPPHIAARRATAVTTQTPTTTTTTQRPTRPWRFSSRATTTRRPETVPWWWTKTTTPVPTTPRTTTTTTTTTEAPTTQAERSETKAGIHFDHANNRTVYRYFWKPNAEEEAIIPEMIDENGNAHSAVPAENVETDQNQQNIDVAPQSEDVVFEEPQPEETTPPPTTTTPPPTTTRSTTPRPPPPRPTTTQSTTSPPPTTTSTTRRPTTFTTAGPRRPTLFERVPEFAPRQPKIIRTSLFDPPPQDTDISEQVEQEVQQNRPQGFRTATGSRVFGTPRVDSYEELPVDQHPLEPWAPTDPPTTSTTTARPSTTTTRRPPQTVASTTTTRVTTTTTEPTTTTEEVIPEAEVATVPEFASDVEDISQFNDEFTEQSVDERELVNILNKEEEQRGVVEAKWFSGAPHSFDKDQQHLSGSPKRFIPEFPGEVDPETFPEGETTEEEDTAAQTPKHIIFTVQPVFTQPATTAPTSAIEQTTTEPSTSTIEEAPRTGFTDETAEEFEGVTIASTVDQIENTTEPLTDEVIDETAEELSQAFADFERVLSTHATEGPIEPPTTSTTTETPSTTTQQPRPVLRQGVRAPTVVVWGRRPPKQPSTMVHLETAPPSIRPTKRPRKKTTKVPAEIDLLDELIRGTTEHVETTTKSITELESELAREAKIQSFFDGSDETTAHPHAEARVRGRTPGRRIRGRKGQNKRVDTSSFIVSALNRDGVHLTHEEARIALGLPGKASRPHSKTTTTTSAPVDDGVQLLVADLQRELLTRGFNEQTFAICNAINCDFEKNDELCLYESSLDELIFGDDAFRRRRKRSALDSFITVRAWTNWGGAKGDPALGNIALASGRLPSDVFSEGKNERFAGTQVNPNQMAMMSTQINATESLRILFDVWEGTRGVQLRVCCDAVCPFETELGVKKGSRNWLPREVICPAGTRQLSFECTNTGKFRGACGVDNIRMDKC